ncbi:MAG: right-handed parallel beta-helix repeat-containing protein [Deltaproteobacteria bacterium]|nr:right-handed parallel beta-helix repeat-containing protein [Deltaproteobacteria bacterium]
MVKDALLRPGTRTRAFSALFVALVLAPVEVRAAAHYVDHVATGANDGTSWANAWKSLAAINWAAVRGGDTIYLSGGVTQKTYDEQLTVGASGVPGQPITIAPGASSPAPAGHGGTVVLDGQGSRPFCVSVSYRQYVTVRGLKLVNAAESGIKASGSDVLVEGNTLEGIRGQAIHFYKCNGCTARQNYVTTLANDPAQTDGVVVYGDSDGVVVEGNHLVLTNQGGSHNDCVQSNRCSNLTVRYNYCENQKDAEGYADAQGIYLTEMRGTSKVYGNVVYLKQGAVGIASSNLTVGTAKSVFVNNTVKCGSYRCIRVTEETDPIVKNNLVWQHRTAAGLYAIELRNWAGKPENIDGNLAFNQSSTGAKIHYLNSAALTWTEWQAQKLDLHGANTDPSLDACYRPDSASDPSVGKALALASELTMGLSMAACPSSAAAWRAGYALVDRGTVGGSSWDVGAFEYGPPRLVDGGAARDRGITDGRLTEAGLLLDGGGDGDSARTDARPQANDGGPGDRDSAAGSAIVPGGGSGDGGCGCGVGRAAIFPAAALPSTAGLVLLVLLFRRRAARSHRLRRPAPFPPAPAPRTGVDSPSCAPHRG